MLVSHQYVFASDQLSLCRRVATHPMGNRELPLESIESKHFCLLDFVL
jgi:hypothetical protein